MWFKHLILYRFTEALDATITAEQLEAALQKMPFKNCQSHDEFSCGFVPAISVRDNSPLVHSASGCLLFKMRKQSKVLPSQAIKKAVGDRIAEREEQESRKLPAKERAGIRDEVIFELLPRALTTDKDTFAYIDTVNNWLVVDAGSFKQAEDVLSMLRKCLGSLPVAPFVGDISAKQVMTQWVDQGSWPKSCIPENNCELSVDDESKPNIKVKNYDVCSDDVMRHLELGFQVVKLAIKWKNNISFTLCDDMRIKRLKFLDLIQEQAQGEECKSQEERHDADFRIMTGVLNEFFNEFLIKNFID